MAHHGNDDHHENTNDPLNRLLPAIGKFVADGIREYVKHGPRKDKTLFDLLDEPEFNNTFAIPKEVLRK
jgi:hypothetical protein